MTNICSKCHCDIVSGDCACPFPYDVCTIHDADDLVPGRICGRPLPCKDHNAPHARATVSGTAENAAPQALDSNRYHQTLGAKWMVEAIIQECRTTYKLNRHAQVFADSLDRRWEDEKFWRSERDELSRVQENRPPLGTNTAENAAPQVLPLCRALVGSLTDLERALAHVTKLRNELADALDKRHESKGCTSQRGVFGHHFGPVNDYTACLDCQKTIAQIHRDQMP
jgi:hypothetical protein